MAKILVSYGLEADRRPYLQALVADGHELVSGSLRPTSTEDEIIRALAGIAGTIAGLERYTDRVFTECQALRAIGRTGVGFDTIDTDAATRHGVAVTTTPGCNHDAVAECALSLILMCARGVHRSERVVRAGGWGLRPPGIEISRKTVAIVGCGLIGRTLAKLLSGFGCRLLGVDTVQDAAWAKSAGVTYVSLDEALPQADIVSIHAPSMPSTRHLLNERTLKLMKPTAYLVNTARGPLVDENAIARALNEGWIAGAGLDVFDIEPLPADSALRSVSPDKLILTGHVAGNSAESTEAMTKMAAENVRRVLRGEPPLHCVNPAVIGHVRA